MDTLTINGIRYEVKKAVTPESAAAEGHAATVDIMRANGQARQLFLKRPNGTRMYFAVEYSSRHGLTYGKVITLGSW